MAAADTLEELRQAGFDESEIEQWSVEKTRELNDAGFSPSEIDDWFGRKSFDPKPIQDVGEKSFEFGRQLTQDEIDGVVGRTRKTVYRALGSDVRPENEPQKTRADVGPAKIVTGFDEALEAGWQISVTGLQRRQNLNLGPPDKVLSEDAPMASRIAAQLATLAGDFPEMVGGYVVGGGQITGVAGAFALPAGMRSVYLRSLENGEVTNFSEFWEMASAAMIDTAKGWITGAATGAAGVVTKPLGPIVQYGSEVATMVTVGKALEGETPSARDFMDAAVVIGGLKGAAAVSGKLKNIYEHTGVNPYKVLADAEKDPTIKQDLLSENKNVPGAYSEGQAIEATKKLITSAATGKPFSGRLLRGQGGESSPYNPLSSGEPVLGDGLYTTTDLNYAKYFGPNITVHNVKLENPLVIKNDEQFMALTGAAGWKVPNPIRLDKKTQSEYIVKLRNYIEERGHDGVIIEVRDTFESYKAGLSDEVSLLGKIFGADQVVEFKKRKPEKDPTIKQDLLSKNKNVPDAYSEGMASKQAKADSETPMVAETDPAKVVDPATAQDRVLARIASEDTGAPWYQRLGEKWHDFYTSRIDRLHPVRQLEKMLSDGKELSAAESPYKLNRLLNGLFGRADHWFEISPYKYQTLENVGKPLAKIMEPVRDDLSGFRAYAVSKRAVELHGRKIETGIDAADALAVVRAGEGKYEQTFRELNEYQTHLLDYLRDSGILSKKAYAAMTEANKDYVPFYRLFGDEFGGPGSGGGVRVRNPVKGIKGSSREILDPIESIIKNTYLYLSLAERNRANRVLIDLAEKSEVGGEFVQRVKTKMRPVEVTEGEVASFLKEHGIEANAEAFTIFRPKGFNPRPDEIVVFRDGKAEVYKINPKVAEALGPADAVSTALTFRIAAKAASLLRAGSVLTPEFMSRNAVRDQFSAFAFSRHGYIPIWDALRGLGGLMRKTAADSADAHYGAWLKGGGANSTLVAIDRQYIQQNVFKLNQETGFINSAINVVKSPVEILRVSSELIENSTRLGAFKRAAKGKTDAKTVFDAAYESREITLDFARIGAKMRALNMITAFQNAQVQGLDRTVRAFAENPQGTFVRAGASITLPSIYLWWANRDDPRYRALPQWQKDLYWIVLTEDAIYRIPKPFELGLLFGSAVERALDAYYLENPDAYKDFSYTLFEAFTPSVVPTVLVPPVEQFANRSMFTGNAIIPSHLEDMLPEYQYQPYTTQASRALGRLIGTIPGAHDSAAASPALIDNYIRGWSGGLGTYVVQIADKSLREAGVLPNPPKPASTLADLPVIKAFVVRYPSAQAQQIQDFYDKFYELKKVSDTVSALAKKGDLDAMEREMNLRPEAMTNLDDTREALTKAARFVQMVYEDPTMTPDDKRQLIDTAYYQMIEMAQFGNELLDDTRKVYGR